MTTLTTNTKDNAAVKAVGCPKCAARKGAICTTTNESRRFNVHEARMTAAAVLKDGAKTAAKGAKAAKAAKKAMVNANAA